MSRPLKFRAWDGTEYFYSDEYDDLATFFVDMAELGVTEFEQFTGRSDKNGVEIYEGDVLRDDWGNTSAVCWDQDVAAFAYAGGEDWGMIGADVKVIGNIHESEVET